MASPTNVNTPLEFFSAIEAGVLDIVITNHLDLTLLPLPLKCERPILAVSLELARTPALTRQCVCRRYISCDDGCDSPVGGINATRSIRVRVRSRFHDTASYSVAPRMQLHVETCALLQPF